MKIGIVQDGPVYLNKEKTLEKVLGLALEAGKQNLDIIAFGETWFSGYPSWLDFCPNIAIWDHEPTKEAYLMTYNTALSIADPEIGAIQEACRANNVAIIIGINEKVEKGPGNGSLYNTILTFGKDGALLNHHRKLMPTYTERLVHAQGDGAGLNQAMHDSGEHLHFCLWPWVHEKHQIASRHYAFEGRCYVVSVGQIMEAQELPSHLELPEGTAPNDSLLKGGSCVVKPDGSYLLEPDFTTRGLITLEIPNFDACIKERMTLDTSGHYQRRDVFDFSVDKNRIN